MHPENADSVVHASETEETRTFPERKEIPSLPASKLAPVLIHLGRSLVETSDKHIAILHQHHCISQCRCKAS